MELSHKIRISDDITVEIRHSVTNKYTWVNLKYMDKIVFQTALEDFKELVKNIQNNIDTFEVICEEFHRVIK